MVQPEYIGRTYRLITHRLRIQRGPGNPDKVVERPRAGSREAGWSEFLDSDENPTLITFDELDQIDVASHLRGGGLCEYAPMVDEEVGEDGEILEPEYPDLA